MRATPLDGSPGRAGVKAVRTVDGDYVLPPGDYAAHYVDAAGRESAPQLLRVQALELPIVRAYCAEPASTDTSRDGRVMVGAIKML